MKQHIQRKIILTLSPSVREALELATKKLKMDPEELTSQSWSGGSQRKDIPNKYGTYHGR